MSFKQPTWPKNGVILQYDESMSSGGVSESITQFIEWDVLKVVDGPVYRIDCQFPGRHIRRSQHTSVCYVEVGKETE